MFCFSSLYLSRACKNPDLEKSSDVMLPTSFIAYYKHIFAFQCIADMEKSEVTVHTAVEKFQHVWNLNLSVPSCFVLSYVSPASTV